jgi:hypothetical protein
MFDHVSFMFWQTRNPIDGTFRMDGYVGKVDEFVVNPENGHITHLVMPEGHLWGQKDVIIPLSAMGDTRQDTVFLKLDKHQVESLRPSRCTGAGPDSWGWLGNPTWTDEKVKTRQDQISCQFARELPING